MSSFPEYLRSVAESHWFNNFILIVIIAAGIVVGIQTYGDDVAHLKPTLFWIDQLILLIFLIEIGIRMGSEGSRPWRYFFDPWNVFDFTIVAVCYAAFFVPDMEGSFVAVFRLARVLRVFRIVRTIPRLQLLVNVLLKSIPSIGYVGLLLSIIFYIYATMGVFLFNGNDPLHFGNLQLSLLSLFRVVTLEDWTDIMYINMYGCNHPVWGYGTEAGCTDPAAMGFWAALFFVSFVLVGTMIVLNLFIGIIMNSMNEAQIDARNEGHKDRPKNLKTELEQLNERVNKLSEDIQDVIHKHLK